MAAWHAYFDDETVAWSEDQVETHAIESTGVRIHIDVYRQAGASVVIMNHGGGGYCKLFVGLARALYERGYSVVLPDQKGQGFSEGPRGDVTIGESVQNVVDVARWVADGTDQPILIAGGSLGSGIAYMAAAVGASHAGVIAHNLYDFTRDALTFTRWPWLAGTVIDRASTALMGQLAGVVGGLRLPVRAFSRFDAMLDERDTGATAAWYADPIPLTGVTLRYMASLATSPPAVPFEANQSRVLVINPTRDRMVAPSVTRRNYERLSGPVTYTEIDWGHWSLRPDFNAEWAAVVDGWWSTHEGREVSEALPDVVLTDGP